jgi:hypothetical protein
VAAENAVKAAAAAEKAAAAAAARAAADAARAAAAAASRARAEAAAKVNRWKVYGAVPPPIHPTSLTKDRFETLRECIEAVLGFQLPENTTCRRGPVGEFQTGTLEFNRDKCIMVISQTVSDPVDINGTIAHKIVQWHVMQVLKVRGDVMQLVCNLAAVHFAGPSEFGVGMLGDFYRTVKANPAKLAQYKWILNNSYPALKSSTEGADFAPRTMVYY